MKRIRFLGLSVIFISFLFLGNIKIFGQKDYQDFTFDKISIKERKVVPYPYLVERDVMFSRRIYRIIDTREKMNIPLAWQRNPLYRIIYEAATKGYGGNPLIAYKNDSLSSILTSEDILKRGGTQEATQVPRDPNDPESELMDTVITNPFRPSEIKRYKLMEDWIFDKQRSMYFIRIIAIAPLYDMKKAGYELKDNDLFWLRWTDFRPVLVNQELFNRHNDAARYSLDDFFEQRIFTSYIIRETNAFDLDINRFEEFKDDKMGSLLEADRIKQRLEMWEQDLWEY